ncbi:stromal membrane-associated protein 1 isoform X2 [Zootermopsis nevadensis]|uniref:stromal membrane-associated protein 1 isoform X2 n=1 Tax=Zootermopsis nevadensis TaxID=136037 RepID=UPI000B8EDAB2|nr:stromal membrane-associated protein 1 isoform X2 [Zootermopsis nevadensis]
MATKAEKDRQKQIQEKCQALLTQMLRDEDNKYCVDCDAKGPRWASWNLGIFLCIRCAGIHRNLGVHISKVKSVNLDTWTPEQVVSLQQMGNSRARAVYEANLPDNFRRPQTDSSLEAFVRAKYEQKKYIAREWVPPSIPKVNWDKELDEEAERQKRRKKEAKQQQQQQQARKTVSDVTVPQLLPKPKGSTSPKPGRTQADLNKPAKTATQDLLGLDTPIGTLSSTSGTGTSGGDDIFSNFLSAPAAAPSALSTSPAPNKADADSNKGRSAEEESFFNQPAPSSQERRQLTKDSILALYSTVPSQAQAGNPASVFGIPGGVYTQTQATGYPQAAVAFGVAGAPAAAVPNGMMQGTQVVQNGIYTTSLPPQQPNLASNPFFNIGAAAVGNTAATTAGFPAMSQLPQQMARMNLGGVAMMAAQPQAVMGQFQPIGMQISSMGMNIAPTMPNTGSAGVGIGVFPPPAGAGHTLATNLWQ